MKVMIVDQYTMFSRYSLFCGVFSILMPFIDYPNGIFSGFIFGIAAVTLSILANQDRKKHTAAKAGRITGIIGILICVMLFCSFYNFYSLVSDPETSDQMISFLSEFLGSYGVSFESFISALRLR
ncbi:MAG: hypothetical protein MJ059_04770 [Lachnospiraceae bacterium]|nr:hypothetical protein [Lachnospiraceae bacterium]